MISFFKSLFGFVANNKKASALIVSGAVIAAKAVGKKAGFDVPEDTVKEVLFAASTYIVGQGIADHGKEAAKVTQGLKGALPTVGKLRPQALTKARTR
jgi:hypothetical protein